MPVFCNVKLQFQFDLGKCGIVWYPATFFLLEILMQMQALLFPTNAFSFDFSLLNLSTEGSKVGRNCEVEEKSIQTEWEKPRRFKGKDEGWVVDSIPL